jgi:Trp operon repressor
MKKNKSDEQIEKSLQKDHWYHFVVLKEKAITENLAKDQDTVFFPPVINAHLFELNKCKLVDEQMNGSNRLKFVKSSWSRALEMLQKQITNAPNGFLLRAILPPDVAEDRIANLENYYENKLIKKHYRWSAKIIFHCQTIRVILGHYSSELKGLLELYFKLKK